MPSTFIESTNVSMSSLNHLKDAITNTSATAPNTSLGALRNWFRDNIGDNGNFTNNHWGSIGMSEFRERFIYAFSAGGWSETQSKYANSDNGGVTFWWAWGDNIRTNFAFYLHGRGWVTPNSANNTGTAFHSLGSGYYAGYAQHRVERSRVGFTIVIGYDSEATYLVNRAGWHDIRGNGGFFRVTRANFG
jgi:hypothetical protein